MNNECNFCYSTHCSIWSHTRNECLTNEDDSLCRTIYLILLRIQKQNRTLINYNIYEVKIFVNWCQFYHIHCPIQLQFQNTSNNFHLIADAFVNSKSIMVVFIQYLCLGLFYFYYLKKNWSINSNNFFWIVKTPTTTIICHVFISNCSIYSHFILPHSLKVIVWWQYFSLTWQPGNRVYLKIIEIEKKKHRKTLKRVTAQ